jgi:hypothetical protein
MLGITKKEDFMKEGQIFDQHAKTDCETLFDQIK